MGVYARAVRIGHGFTPTKICERVFPNMLKAIIWARKIRKEAPEWKIEINGRHVINQDAHDALFKRRERLWLEVQHGYIWTWQASHEYDEVIREHRKQP